MHMINKIPITLFLLIVPNLVFSADFTLPILSITDNESGTQEVSLNLKILLLMSSLTFLPALLITMTSFTRIIIVLSILRQAIGLAQAPTNQILLGIALFLTFYTMMPVFNNINEEAIQPYMNEEIKFLPALEISTVPVKNFMLKHTRENDLALFAELSKTEMTENIPFNVLLPAFMTSELKTAFQIGFIIFIPFIIIDLLVASVLMSMGMMMLSPLIISLPFKILLFVSIDGRIHKRRKP